MTSSNPAEGDIYKELEIEIFHQWSKKYRFLFFSCENMFSLAKKFKKWKKYASLVHFDIVYYFKFVFKKDFLKTVNKCVFHEKLGYL